MERARRLAASERVREMGDRTSQESIVGLTTDQETNFRRVAISRTYQSRRVGLQERLLGRLKPSSDVPGPHGQGCRDGPGRVALSRSSKIGIKLLNTEKAPISGLRLAPHPDSSPLI